MASEINWHVRHDDEIWEYADGIGKWIANCSSAEIAKQIVGAINTRPAPVNANPLASNTVDDKIEPDTDGNAPAATDTGLVTAWVTPREMLEAFGADDIREGSRAVLGDGIEEDEWEDYLEVPVHALEKMLRELVTRSQAEELLAAERALAETATRQNALLWKRNEALKAKLAAAEKALTMPDAERRLFFISDLLARQGYFNRADLCDAFGVSVPQASIDIRKWLETHNGAVAYNKKSKRYECTARAALRGDA
ncbi:MULTISPECIES: hypothetical protein [unclassified Brucella]|uniref:hypothetical protein n=1 Tax=unclassified Brucella TaxID=2632610 RepID=UPI0012ADE84B|nr:MULTISPECIES: hypothetical protein [unclassified Brucella]MRN43427.1 hypothetical protein [Brucella sp. 09RB8913]MRN59401.1 hypothetical protein [Brucella sp. 09RB8918]MRN67943.1 hypothetical protein [Brucella sp. 10RB9213]